MAGVHEQQRPNLRFGINGCGLLLAMMIVNLIGILIIAIVYAMGTTVLGVGEIVALAMWLVVQVCLLYVVFLCIRRSGCG